MRPHFAEMSQFAEEIGRRDRPMLRRSEYRGDKVLQRWRGSGGNIRLSHLLRSFLSV